MYICPECNRTFSKEENISKHYLICWKENHTIKNSKDAPRSADVETRECNQDILNFFNSFKEK